MKRQLIATGLAVLAASAFGASDGVVHADVVIYGSSPAAISAAVQAKRMGASAVVVSPETRIGGLTTGGLGQTDIGNKAAFGGIALEFYKAVGKYYGEQTDKWRFEPSAALSILEGWEKRDALDIRRGEWLDRENGVTTKDGRIVSMTTLSGCTYCGKVFVDATYEGDLMAAAGVSYRVGREANFVYGETLNGNQPELAVHHQLCPGVDPYVVPGDPSSGLLPGIEPYDPDFRTGDGDSRVQAYCFRMCLTDDPMNRIPFVRPEGYDERDFELMFRHYEAAPKGQKFAPPWINSKMPNRKTDTNNKRGFSMDYIGQSWRWAEATYEERAKILAAHLKYQKGLMWTLANHPRVPESIRNEVSRWGTCKDEFLDGFGDGWQKQLYVREARRMIGEYVMTEHNCRGKAVAPHPVAMGAYAMDSHHVRRYVGADGFVHNEGDVEVGKDENGKRYPPYSIDYGAIVPKREECANLLVPVCLSASHIAFGSIRMEPVFFALGQAAGTAAALAAADGSPVQDVPYAALRKRLVADGQVIELAAPVTAAEEKKSGGSHLDEIAESLKPLRTWALPYAAGVPYEAFVSRKIPPKSGPTGEGQAWTKLSVEEFFPFIDRYGQFMHKDWPDKVHSDADFAARREKEEKDLAAHPGPKGWDRWGGWVDGPQLEKTGGFSTAKWNGKWWIVDPDGHLWWSHGPVRVSPSSATTPLAVPKSDRSHWFAELPARDDPVFGSFYESSDVLLWPYYGKRGIDKVYDFSAANLRRKYGEKWFETWADLAHRRLRSWGCNTIANGSDKRICLMDRTPYTERFEIHSRPIAGHKGGWWEFPDPFDPSFRAEAHRMTEVYKAEIADPWCMGFFVDNEHKWGKPHSFGLSTLKSPSNQPCKEVFRDRLKAKYGTVENLNAAWGMDYADWDAFLASTAEPKSQKGAMDDLEAFSSEIAENYFRTIREELKKANPGKLYLGCRFAGAPEFAVRAAAKYCDVISYNVYRTEMSEFKLPDGVDAPVLIGEFHFGALDRGPFCPGLILLKDQNHRAQTYKEYVRTSLEHPQIVGVHWHQFSDQATSGRFDGENMQVGWTDVCDTPYWETIDAVRQMGGRMYEIRAGGNIGVEEEESANIEAFDRNMAVAEVAANGLKWIDGKQLPIEGRAFDDTECYYDRLPANVTANVNGGVRLMKHHTAGMQFRFKTDSRKLVFKWVPYSERLTMDHMPFTGVSGIDVYRFDAECGKWLYVKTGRIKSAKGGSLKLDWTPGTPCLVNLPLYNGIKEFEVGIEPDAAIGPVGPRKSGVAKPVVFYGTSITQGGCASRPGMSFVNIVGRELDVPVVNLGFSGSGVMEFEMSEHLARIDASCYVLDCLWNMGMAKERDVPSRRGRNVDENYETFIRNLRTNRPDVPIVMAERCDVYCKAQNSQDRFIRALYEKLVAEGWNNLVYLSKGDMYPQDLEGTVDGTHPNDWGMMALAKAYGNAVKKALGLTKQAKLER